MIDLWEHLSVSKEQLVWCLNYLLDLSKDKNYKKRQKLDSHVHFINFTKNKNCLTKKFKKFKPLAVGSYDMRLESLHKSEHHFTFLGKREERK